MEQNASRRLPVKATTLTNFFFLIHVPQETSSSQAKEAKTSGTE